MARKILNRKKLRKELDEANRGNQLAEDLGLPTGNGDLPTGEGGKGKTVKRGTNKKAPKQTQSFLPDPDGEGDGATMAPETHKDIEKQADIYADVRDGRMEMTERESEEQGKLLELMKKHGVRKYKLPDGRLCEVVPGDEKVKVRKPKAKLADE